MVIPLRNYPMRLIYWMLFLCPLLFICGALLVASFLSHAVYPAPNWFAVDSAERIFFSRSDGIHVHEAQEEIAHHRITDAAARIYISPDDILVIVNNGQALSFDLAQSDLAHNAFHPLQAPLSEDELRDLIGSRPFDHCTQNGLIYRYESGFLRYRIVRESDTGAQILYRMPAKDCVARWLLILLVLSFLALIAVCIVVSQRYWIWRRRQPDAPQRLRDYFK